MTDQSRREFLNKLARGVAYSAPVIATLQVPENLMAQGVSATKKGMGGGITGGGRGGGAKKTSPAPIGPSAPGASPTG
jgi:hypothetical protein